MRSITEITFCLNARGMLRFIPDKIWLKYAYKKYTNGNLNLDRPKTFNEKLQWLKINDRNPQYTNMVDKYEAKKFVSEIIGEEYIIKTIGLWNCFDEINFADLPEKFVLKCTHDSGGVVICKSKDLFNKGEARNILNKAMSRNYYYHGREWPYKNVKPRIFAEQYIVDESGFELKDYKLFCFNGEPKLVLVCSDRFSPEGLCETWFDDNWNLLNLTEGGHRRDLTIKKPVQFDLMKTLARKLSINVPFLRVDFYETNDKLYFGELTFFPASGFEKFNPEQWDLKLGEMIHLPLQK